ncbi:9601_t:CDS:2 [Dentiscutata erythropus]|uniref:9601_t:CDS:1 n=1 Tax=Dentiscutata erythropus TaxID=1348616 RepID=A0A9N9IES4_9GLOM|nr:9601_t:CDS:2 [Dentiscutata erythropus]
MTFTETTQTSIEKNDDLRIQELIAASQKLLSQNTQPPTPTATSSSGFNFHPDTVGQEKQQLRARKPKTKASSEHLNGFGDASDMSLPMSHNGSTPSVVSMTNGSTPAHLVINNGTTVGNINSGSNSPSSSGSSTSTNSMNGTRGERRSYKERNDPEISTSPPELIRDPTSESFSTHTHIWPIVFAVVPPMGALIYGKSDVWSDFLLLLLIAFYLYNIIKVPWELYYAARSRRVINENLPGQTADPAQEAQRNQAAKELRIQEMWALLLVVASPIIGGYALHGAKMYLTDYDKYISHFNIMLFVFAAGIRPLMHIANLAKNRTLHLQEQVHYPSTEVELLKRRVQHLEYEFSQLRRGFATKRDVINVRDGFEPTITQLNKAVRRYEKKEQYLRNYSEERFAYLESKLREFDTIISYKLQDEQISVPRNMMQFMFLPFNIAFTILGYATYFLPRSLRGARPAPMLQPASNSDDDDGNRSNGDMSQQEISFSGSLQKY